MKRLRDKIDPVDVIVSIVTGSISGVIAGIVLKWLS